jgi:hypothetical protein
MRRSIVPLAIVAAALALAGCASGTPAATPSTSASTPAASPSTEAKLAAGWLENGRAIGVVTWGSSTCVPVGGAASVDGETISIPLSDAADEGACTRDYVPRVTLVATPDGVDPAADHIVAVTGGAAAAQAKLAGVAGLGGPSAAPTDGPSAGWTAEEGLFVLVTYGSGCSPQVKEVAATGDAEVTVTFAKPPAGQVCTMSYGPRASVAQVSGLKASEDVTAVLNGDGLQGVRIPIVGAN